MTEPGHNLQERVVQAAEAVLKRNGSVGPLELFQELRWLNPVHLEAWQKGNEFYPVLEKWIHVGSGKRDRAIQSFLDWAKQRGLRPIEATYARHGARGVEALQVTRDRDEAGEKFFRTHYAAADLSVKKSARLAKKLNKPPDLVVFEKAGEPGHCHECNAELAEGDRLFLEKGQPLCLICADLDELVFLPAGNMALTRRARKHSALSAVVVRFNRPRKRYERQGVLVTPEALVQAESECAADAPDRAAARARAAVSRQHEDREFVEAMTQAILKLYPACPPDSARCIAAHAGQRSSGRVGRSAAGRALESRAIELAVIAHIRHQHTNYDQLLMQGIERLNARVIIRQKIEQVLAQWSAS